MWTARERKSLFRNIGVNVFGGVMRRSVVVKDPVGRALMSGLR
jgi:hypothetical protein